MSATFYPSQLGSGATASKTPLAYTGNPLDLTISDLKLIWSKIYCAWGVLSPLRLWPTFELDEFDELYPSPKNLVAIITHVILVFLQAIFIASIPIAAFIPFVPLWAFIGWVTGFLVFNHYVCTWFLNGRKNKLISNVGVKDPSKHQQEYWIYLNGVSVGHDWLQANIDRLSYTFGREIVGVLNPTAGILFDLIQCMVQRNLCYSTQDIRDAYALIKEALLNEKYQKVVFLLHSQGGIEGGLVIDWLLDEIPQDRMQRMEVYTFGNAANHFNNPHRNIAGAQSAQATLNTGPTKQQKALRYVEHYANDGDFVAQFGVLNFMQVPNRFNGRVFKSPGSGHLLNMHYLHEMFPLEPITDKKYRAKEQSDFMDMSMPIAAESPDDHREDLFTSMLGSGTQEEVQRAFVGDVNTPISPLMLNSASIDGVINNVDGSPTAEQKAAKKDFKVKHFSRLWMYRNGASPPVDKDLIPRVATL